MIYTCCDQRRRDKVLTDSTLNGIDFLEVVDRGAPVGTPRQRTLLVRLLRSATGLDADNVVIEGGERITPVRVLWAHSATAIPPADLGAEDGAFFTALPAAATTLVVRTDAAGDYSTYTLRIVRSRIDLRPPDTFDPPLASIDFSFKVECPTDFDCRADRVCAEEPVAAPEISYLAKDYASFRRLILDRLSMLMPGWRDRSPADVGIALVEVLAYVADHLSYQQDAIATEAYLGTARRRVSVRRHARLVDYRIHDGGSARTWIQLRADKAADDLNPANPIIVPKKTMLFTRVADANDRIPLTNPTPGKPDPLNLALRQNPTVFETLQPIRLFKDHDRLPFYTWSDAECCLPKGATRATLKGHFPHLTAATAQRQGDVLVFEEVLGPLTGRAEDADPVKRHAVMLTAVRFTNELNAPLTDPVTTEQITELRWHEDDALPFPLCVSSRTDRDHGELPVADVSVARGNIVVADHGRTIPEEALAAVPEPHLFLVSATAADRCDRPERQAVPPRYRRMLSERPLTHAVAYDENAPPTSARATMTWSPGDLWPEVGLTETSSAAGLSWEARTDLLDSDAADRHFVAEMESDGGVILRFGDDRHAMRPQSGTTFSATYRIGQGSVGNIGAEALVHIVSDDNRIASARNPLPAIGGIDAESIEDVRQRAPFAFRTLERAVTPEDYATIAERHAGVQRAAATFRWTGSWHTAFVTIDRPGGLVVTPAFEETMRSHIEPYRTAGYDLEVDSPRFASLKLDLFICVVRDYFRSNVKAAVLAALSNRSFADGRRGLFHPDNLTFAQPIYLSSIYAAVQAIAGVDSVEITRFHRQGQADRKALDAGRLDLGRLEIARLDNDPNFPERGVLRLTLGGGK